MSRVVALVVFGALWLAGGSRVDSDGWAIVFYAVGAVIALVAFDDERDQRRRPPRR